MFRHQVVLSIGTILFEVLSWSRISAAHNPMYGRWGFDEQGDDTQTKPGDDFFQFANGAWIDNTPIPSDKDGESLRQQAAARTTEQLHALIETAAASADHVPKTLAGKVGAYYKAVMDEKRVDHLGISAISQELAANRNGSKRQLERTARIKTYIPVLVHRHVKALLRERRRA